MNTIDDTDDIDLSSLDLDTLWIDSTETCLDEYASFYKKDATTITVARVYINPDNIVVRVSSNEETLDAPNTLSFQQMCSLAGDDYVWKKYLYTIIVDDDSIEVMDNDNISFIELTDMVQDIKIEPTIAHFHEINTIFLLIKEQPKQHSVPVESNNMHSALEIELGSAKSLTRKKRKHYKSTVGGTKTRRVYDTNFKIEQ